MTPKAILMILLFLSAILVLYPWITSLIDIQQLFDRYEGISPEELKARDNLVLQIVGVVFLYLVLAFGLNFEVGEAQNTFIQQEEEKPIKTRQTARIEMPKKMPNKATRILTKKGQNIIALLSTLTFILVFVWQIFSNMPTNLTSMGSDLVMFFIEQAFVAGIACISVGIIAYIGVKYR